MSRLALVTATTNHRAAEACISSWIDRADEPPIVEIVFNGGGHGPYLGTVPAFRQGVDRVLADHPEASVIACLHDDLEILESGWDARVLRHFDRQPPCGLLGFGGAIGLGHEQLYERPYDPMLLARQGFRSNLTNAEQHGIRSLRAERVACLDGFSQIGRREFWLGSHRDADPYFSPAPSNRPWTVLDDLGVVHHFYDGLLGCLARRAGWETWYLPIACRHFGGRTAVGDPGYQGWAAGQVEGGDHAFWQAAHRIGYAAFKDVLPLRV